MSWIDDLIAELCPDGVEFKALGDIAEMVRGNGMPKSDFTESGVGCIHYGQIYTHYGVWATDTISFVAPGTAKPLAKVDPGDLIITNTSENVEDVCKAVAWLGEAQIVTGGHATVIKHRQEPKYLSYYFRTQDFFAKKKKQATGTKVIDVSAKRLAQIIVPVPPLEIQREIVEILDKFTKLEAELEAELEARQRQYKHYRETLLSFRKRTDSASKQESIRWMSLNELGTFVRGRRFTKADVVEDGIPSIHYGEIYTHYGVATSSTISHLRADMARQLRYAKRNDVIIAAVGETVEDVGKAVAWLGDQEVAVHDDCFVFRHSMNAKFVSYWFQTDDFHTQKNKYVARAKVKRLSGESLAKIIMPAPALEEQERIVSILDKFDALVNDLSSGIPAEIKVRRRQYEHYRDRLLTFAEAA